MLNRRIYKICFHKTYLKIEIISEGAAEFINFSELNCPTFYDVDDDEYTIIYRSSKAITPDLSIEEPDNSVSMGDTHLSTILEAESDKVIKSSVENLVPIPRESKGVFDDTCDVPFVDNDSFEDIDYIEASPPEDFLIMGNGELSTIPEKESDEFIKSSVEDLIPSKRESRIHRGIDS
ncbi:hypothetical protein Tco_1200259 [Tanacetum coccineum]